MSIKINILHICGILKLLIWQFIGWFRSNYNRLVPWWHEYPWIRCRPLGGYRLDDPPPKDPPLRKPLGGFPLNCGYELALLGN